MEKASSLQCFYFQDQCLVLFKFSHIFSLCGELRSQGGNPVLLTEILKLSLRLKGWKYAGNASSGESCFNMDFEFRVSGHSLRSHEHNWTKSKLRKRPSQQRSPTTYPELSSTQASWLSLAAQHLTVFFLHTLRVETRRSFSNSSPADARF
eukprot:TRINITY_DN5155_c0_g1_i1.p1 TRINITY_DN5155_c0_g1~~TRINITY_DN5155_c0_g1_i1.p1  ORF type:complete len:151 (+),score=1.60 TRINITY_DN5155_c0_g1_i1:386-838(+)